MYVYIYCVKCVDLNTIKIIKIWHNEKLVQLYCYVRWLDYNKCNKINWEVYIF